PERRANLHLVAVSATAAQFLIHSRPTVPSLMPLRPKTSPRRWFGKNSDNSSLPMEAVAPREIGTVGTRSAYPLYGANPHIDQGYASVVLQNGSDLNRVKQKW